MSKLLNRDMLKQPAYEVEEIIKVNRRNDLLVGEMATISAIKGQQFGREIFASIIKFKDLMDFLQVFPSVQRIIVPRRVAKIKQYVMSYLDDNSKMRFFPAITVTARGDIYYNEKTNQVAINTNTSKLSINDGQHRFYGVAEALKELQVKVNKAKDVHTYNSLLAKIEELKEMTITMTIFNNLSEEEEKQLFHDTNNLSQRPSRSATIRLAQTDLIAVLARDIADSNKYLKYYGVEYNKMSIWDKNPNTILLTTIYAVIKQLFLKEYKANNEFLTMENYDHYKKVVQDTFNDLFFVLPPDLEVKGKYVLGKNFALRGIAKFIHHCRVEIQLEDKHTFDAISKVDWTTNLEYWERYGATVSAKGIIQFPGNGEGGITSVLNACFDTLFPHEKKD